MFEKIFNQDDYIPADQSVISDYNQDTQGLHDEIQTLWEYDLTLQNRESLFNRLDQHLNALAELSDEWQMLDQVHHVDSAIEMAFDRFVDVLRGMDAKAGTHILRASHLSHYRAYTSVELNALMQNFQNNLLDFLEEQIAAAKNDDHNLQDLIQESSEEAKAVYNRLGRYIRYQFISQKLWQWSSGVSITVGCSAAVLKGLSSTMLPLLIGSSVMSLWVGTFKKPLLSWMSKQLDPLWLQRSLTHPALMPYQNEILLAQWQHHQAHHKTRQSQHKNILKFLRKHRRSHTSPDVSHGALGLRHMLLRKG